MEQQGDAGTGSSTPSVTRAEAQLARLATFPEDNPNLVIETDLAGRVSYANPVARRRFPDLEDLGADHAILSPLAEVVPLLLSGDRTARSREVTVGSSIFETKICFAEIAGQQLIRVYASDVTAMRKAERTVHELASRVVRAQEEERRRISRELHDEAGQALTALKIGLSVIRGDEALDADTLRENLDEAIALVEDTHERIRSLAHGLRPASLDAVGLTATLDDLCRQFAHRTGLAIAFVADELPEIGDDVQICLYRLVQEALTNCAVHADAHTVEVRLRVGAGALVLCVDDDGRGTDLLTLDRPGRAGFGLVGMQERIELLDGRLELSSDPGAGFHLVATLPLPEAG